MNMDVQPAVQFAFRDDWFVQALLRHRLLTEEEYREMAQTAVDEPYFINLVLTRRLLGKNEIAFLLRNALHIPVMNLDAVMFDPRAIEMVPEDICLNFNLIPVEADDISLTVAMANPFDDQALTQLRMITRLYIRSYFAFVDDIQRKIADLYSPDKFLNTIISKTAVKHHVVIAGDEYIADDSPVVKLVNLIISDAIEKDASDIHIEPRQHDVVVRFRIDGILQKILEIPKNSHAALVSRIKIISGLDISEKRKPQDGKARVFVDEIDFDLRVSVLPTAFGEKIVIRILDKRKARVSFEDLGITEHNLELLRRAFSRKEGLILVTGPTGSGKTTTLYAALNQIKSTANNILTIEDPIEYELDGINQVQVNEKAGVTFATALRSFLRQDPDVILVGEIRDRETAEIAIQASLTGHLVLSTLHTNSALATITRLVDMGIDPFKIADALQAVISQRLVRRLCKACAQQIETVEDPILQQLQSQNPNATFYQAKGCQFCNYTGYRGRIGVYEILLLDQDVRAAITRGADLNQIAAQLRESGFRSLQEDALQLVAEGITDLAEIRRVISLDEWPKDAPVVTEAPSSPDEAPTHSDKPVQILMVEDDSVLRRMVQKYLQTHTDWEFIEAGNGVEALEKLQTLRPDVIVLDVMMPEMDGFEFLRRFRADLSNNAIPVIILSALADEKNQLKGFQEGADDYLIKPVPPELLVARIERFVKRQRQDGREN